MDVAHWLTENFIALSLNIAESFTIRDMQIMTKTTQSKFKYFLPHPYEKTGTMTTRS